EKMFGNARCILWCILAAVVVLCVSGCAKEEKKAMLEVEDYELVMRKEGGRSNLFIIDAKGTIVNKGETDVRNLEVTGYCRTCEEEVINGEWFVSEYEKTSHQKDIISSMPAGSRRDFEFEEIAFYPAPEGVAEPERIPEEHDFEIVIESYEIEQ
ncbi:MAG: hypothetical protein ACOCQI_04675, partial [Desulfosalsimonas sp.]